MIEYILIGIAGVVGGYILFRVLSFAVFKSWFDAKLQNKKRRDDHETE
jgi:uncharacterized membrane protein YuzA (DUF378 family)